MSFKALTFNQNVHMAWSNMTIQSTCIGWKNLILVVGVLINKRKWVRRPFFLPFQSKIPIGCWEIEEKGQHEARTPCHAIPIKDTNKVLRNKNRIKIEGWNTISCHSSQGSRIMVITLIHVSQLTFFQFYKTRWFHL